FCHVCQVYPSGADCNSGGAEPGLCCGSKSQGSKGMENPVAQCISQFPAASADYAGTVPRLSIGGNRCGGGYLYLSRPGKSGGICHNRIRLSPDSGVCLMDFSDLYGG